MSDYLPQGYPLTVTYTTDDGREVTEPVIGWKLQGVMRPEPITPSAGSIEDFHRARDLTYRRPTSSDG
jgi:hypothetical protein